MGDLPKELREQIYILEKLGLINDAKFSASVRDAAAEIERLTARAKAAEAERDRLQNALAQIEFEASSAQEGYDQNGPTWTSPKTGDEYENTSDYLALANSIADVARAALGGEG